MRRKRRRPSSMGCCHRVPQTRGGQAPPDHDQGPVSSFAHCEEPSVHKTGGSFFVCLSSPRPSKPSRGSLMPWTTPRLTRPEEQPSLGQLVWGGTPTGGRS